MSDRAFATITYPSWADIMLADAGAFEAKVELHELWKLFGPAREVDLVEVRSTYSHDEEEEANGGEHRWQEKLRGLGVPYDAYWGAGYEFGEGEEKYRYNPEHGDFEIFVYGVDVNNSLAEKLMAYLDDNQNTGYQKVLVGLSCIVSNFRKSAGYEIPGIKEEGYSIPPMLKHDVADLLVSSWEAQDEIDEKA